MLMWEHSVPHTEKASLLVLFTGISSVYVESHGSFADRFLSPTWRACESFEEPRHPSSTTQ